MFLNPLQTSCAGWEGSRQPPSRGCWVGTDPFLTSGEQSCGSVLSNHGLQPAPPQPPKHLLLVKLLAQVWIRGRESRIPVWFPSLPPCVVPMSLLLLAVCTCWEHPWLGVRRLSLEHPELSVCSVCYLPLHDACRCDQSLSQAPM